MLVLTASYRIGALASLESGVLVPLLGDCLEGSSSDLLIPPCWPPSDCIVALPKEEASSCEFTDVSDNSLFFSEGGSFGLEVVEFIFFLAGVLVLSGLGGPLFLFGDFMDVLLYPEMIA